MTAAELRLARVALGLTGQELAALMDCSLRSVRYYLAGEQEVPRLRADAVRREVQRRRKGAQLRRAT